MKLKIEFEPMDFDGEKIIVPVGASAVQYPFVIHMNESAAHILDLLKNEITEEELWADMSRHFQISHEQAAADAAELLGQLREEGLVAP